VIGEIWRECPMVDIPENSGKTVTIMLMETIGQGLAMPRG
jgi:hypothetical protein